MRELGRSMLEMLGVLALVGILSITAIAGYSYAMNKYKAGKTIDELTKRALGCVEQLNQGRSEIHLDEYSVKTLLGYDVTEMKLEQTDFFKITIQNVPEKVCEQILKSEWKMPLAIKVNDVQYDGNMLICHNEKQFGAIEFLFNKNLDGSLPQEVQKCEPDCINGLECVDEKCVCPSERVECGGSCCAGNITVCTAFDTCPNCASNGDCDNNEYCKMNKLASESNQSGTCTKIQIAAQFTYNGIEYIYPKGDYYYTDVKRICELFGKRLANRADITEDIREELWRRANETGQGFYTDEAFNALGTLWCYRLHMQRFYSCTQNWPMSALCM